MANLELTDLLKSFEEHTSYQNPSGAPKQIASQPTKAAKPAKGAAKIMKQMVSDGLPIDDEGISGQAGDTELANIEKIWQAVSDVEDY